MDKNLKLILVKTVHTAVWAVMAAAAFFILYSGVTGASGTLLWVSIGLLVIETLVLLANRWTCPLTPIAMKYTDERTDNFDIYLPKLVAKHNKTFFGIVFIVGLLLVAYNALSSYQ